MSQSLESASADPNAVAIQETSDWLVEQGLTGGELTTVLAQFCQRLVEQGFAIRRVHLTSRTLHPSFAAIGCTWRRDQAVEAVIYDYDEGDREPWLESPLRALVESSRKTLRRHLVGPDAQLDFPVLKDLRDQGMTDWFAIKVVFGGAHTASSLAGIVLTWGCDRPTGFTAQEIAAIKRLAPRFALVCYRMNLEQVAVNLLDTYVGSEAGMRILGGHIRRGDLERLDAVILFADLRGFTRAADTTPAERLVQGLNDYLGSLTEAIEAEGGQVLKFLGDGLLAVFAVADSGVGTMCHAALAASHQALAENARLIQVHRAAGEPALPLDIALHQGEVLYGNVGSAKRLDFTIIGPAVNEASRIESLCEPLGQSLLLSAHFVHCAGIPARSLGTHQLRGIAEPREVFALTEAVN